MFYPRDNEDVNVVILTVDVNISLDYHGQAASGKRQAASGKRQAASGKRQAASGKRQAASGKRQCYSYLNMLPYAPEIFRRGKFILALQNNVINSVRVIFTLGAEVSLRLSALMMFLFHKLQES
jgi:hypothetical protein